LKFSEETALDGVPQKIGVNLTEASQELKLLLINQIQSWIFIHNFIIIIVTVSSWQYL
jgi:hypothetical protein